MAIQPILIDGDWCEAQSREGEFCAVAPRTDTPIDELYPISSFSELESALFAARQAISELHSFSPEKIANFLEILRIISRTVQKF